MSDLLRSLGISESGIDPPALYFVMAALACVIVHAQLRSRAIDTPSSILILFYFGAAVTTVAVMWLVFRIENENLRYVVGFVYLTTLVFAVRRFGQRFLGMNSGAQTNPPEK